VATTIYAVGRVRPEPGDNRYDETVLEDEGVWYFERDVVQAMVNEKNLALTEQINTRRTVEWTITNQDVLEHNALVQAGLRTGAYRASRPYPTEVTVDNLTKQSREYFTVEEAEVRG
jgi:hypothetical protein